MKPFTPFNFMKGVERLRYFTRIDQNTWLIQSEKDYMNECFYVTLIPEGICMSGDYDGLIVRPFTRSAWETIRWMAGATTLSYFAEKAILGNQYHKTKEFDEDHAIKELAEDIAMRLDIEGIADDIKSAFYVQSDIEEIAQKAKKENTALTEEDVEKLKEVLQDCNDAYLEFEHHFYEFGQELERKYGFGDLWEIDYTQYTRQIRWQQSCLIWWARNMMHIKNGENPNNIEYVERNDGKNDGIEPLLTTR